MQYSDGTIAKIGDFVVGKGYNLKDESGNLKTIVGEVVGLIENSETCNVRVMTLVSRIEEPHYTQEPSEFSYKHQHGEPVTVVKTVLEYGEAKQFRLIHRPKKLRPRNRSDLWTPAEKAIQAAADAVEAVGADTCLTEAVTLLSQARDKVADFVDKQSAGF